MKGVDLYDKKKASDTSTKIHRNTTNRSVGFIRTSNGGRHDNTDGNIHIGYYTSDQ